MHYDIESALAIVGGEALDEAIKQAESQNITLNVNYNQSESKISYCLKNFYKLGKRKKRSLLDEKLNHLDSDTNGIYMGDANAVGVRKLLSTSSEPSFEDVENEVLANDIVSKALGTDVCRYCVSKCPEK